MPASDAGEVRLGAGVIAALVLWVAVTRVVSFWIDPFGWDEGFYMIAGKELLAGRLPYVDVWDYKPVGLFLIYAAMMAFAGKSASVVVAGSMLAVAATTLLVAAIGARAFGRRRAGLYAGILFPAYMLVCEGNGANAENFFVVFGALSFLLLGTHLRAAAGMAQHRRVAFAFGLVQGLALQVKFLTAPETACLGLVFGLYVLAERRRLLDGVQLFLSFLPGFLLPTALVFLWFWMAGQLHELVFANFVSASGYARTPFGLADPLRSLQQIARAAYGQAPLMLAAAISLVAVVLPALWRGPGRAAAPYWLLAAWLLGTGLGATYTGNFFDHYFIALAAPLCVLAGLAIDRLGGETRGRLLRVGVLAALVAVPLALDARALARRLHQPIVNPAWAIADEVRRLVPPGTRIYVINLTPEIYILSETWPTGRFSFSWQLTEERFLPYGIDVEREVERTFAGRPELIVVQRAYFEERPSRTAPLFFDRVARDYQEVPIADEALRRQVVIFRRRADRI